MLLHSYQIDRLTNRLYKLNRICDFYIKSGMLIKYKRTLTMFIKLNDRLNEINRKRAA